ncbi:MAG: sugar nucleotide-binding protein, partial [Bacteroidales bacterium]|nr:sugar nucleotide-binding protein [Bacteroidales bacterium]
MGVCSWYDFALKIKEYTNLPCRIQAVPTKHYPLPAKRPAYSVLSKEKIISTYKLNIPGWEEGLRDCLKRLNP